ncbi:polyubiquitin-like [Clytia hemisphaerica]
MTEEEIKENQKENSQVEVLIYPSEWTEILSWKPIYTLKFDDINQISIADVKKGIEAENHANISRDKMLLFKKPQDRTKLQSTLSRPTFEFLKDDMKLELEHFSDAVELCLAGKKCLALAIRKGLRQPKWRNVALITHFTIKSFGTGKTILIMREKLGMGNLKYLIQSKTEILIPDQVLVYENGEKSDENKQNLNITDMYLAIRPGAKVGEHIALKWDIKLFKTIRLVFLTREDELEPKEFQNVLKVQTYIKEKYNVNMKNQVLLHNGIELKYTQNLFELFLKMKDPTEEMRLNLIAVQQPLDLKVVTLNKATYRIKVEPLLTIEQIKDMVSQRSKMPVAHFELFVNDSKLQFEDHKTLQDYDHMIDCENTIVITLKTVLKIRLHFEDPNEIKEECVLIDEEYGRITLRQHLRKIRKKHGLKKREMVLISDENGLGYRWSLGIGGRRRERDYQLMDLLNFSLDYHIIRGGGERRNCQVM